MKPFVVLFLGLFMAHTAAAQTVTVNGKVTESDSDITLIGVNVVVQGTSRGTTTDLDGNFSLPEVSIGETLVITYTGYATQEIVVNDDSFLNIEMGEDVAILDEIVVIGYGTQNKRDVTGAVSIIDNETISKLNPVKIEQALQGTTAGVNITTQSGSPGAGLDIRIRGIATNGQNAPIAIIDGIQGDLSILNPEDIESITVLKDAQAAIYGTIGANGIILVTTKTGERDSPAAISYDAFAGFQQTTRRLDLLNTLEYGTLINERYVAGGEVPLFPVLTELQNDIDWQDELFENAPMHSHNVSISGGSSNVRYSLGGSFLDQEGIIGREKSDFTRGTARSNLIIDVTDDFKLTTVLTYTNFRRRTLAENSLGSVLFNAINYSPTFALDQEDVNGFFGNEVINPLSQIDNTFNNFDFNKLNGAFSGEWRYLPNTTITARVGFNTANSEGRNFTPIYNYGSGKVFNVDRSQVNLSRVNDNDVTFDLYNTYANTFWGHHNVIFTVGMTAFKQFGDGLFGSRLDVQNNAWEFADLSTANGIGEDASNGSYAYDERRLSFFGRLQYDFKRKYLLSLMLRRDASTKFGPNNRVGIFPSITAGWVLSDEDFFPQGNTLSFLKLRASYGVLGNDQIPNNGYVGSLSGEATYVINGALVNGNAIGILPNPDLQWEEARKFDVGVDFKLFNERLSITTDYFINNRSNLLIPFIPVSGIFGTAAPGAGSPTINAGSVRNQGFELVMGYGLNLSEKTRLDLNFNMTTLDNVVTAINGADFIEGGAFSVGQPAPSRMEVGQPIGYFYGYQTDGIFQTQAEVERHPDQSALGGAARPGDLRFVDINGDGVIDTDDRTNIGNPIPEMTMGFNLSLSVGQFDFSTFLFASIGNDMVRNYERNQPNVNQLAYYLERWTGPGTSNEVPRLTTGATSNNVFSDFYIEDASFLRIQNLQLGYSLPPSLLSKFGINEFRLYASVQNLFTFTDYQGYDPGASSGAPIGGGIDNGFYPIPRIAIFGLNLKF